MRTLFSIVALLIPASYLAFIYLFFDRNKARNHPSNVRLRFFAAALNNICCLVLTYFLLHTWRNESSPPVFIEMGFSIQRLTYVILFPTFLTILLYFGSLVTLYFAGNFTITWNDTVGDICWIRTAIMAPITEEMSFRACSATLFRHCFGRTTTTFVSPLFFSLAHLHHISDDRKMGLSLKGALMLRMFQASYTYLFGVYATHLFLSTGNILAPILTHSICNCFGLPNIDVVSKLPELRRMPAAVAHFCGFLMWISLLPTLTDARIYSSTHNP